MSFTKSVTLPVPPDEAFALVTQPERLRRWQTVSAYVDLRAGGAYRWTVTPGHVAGGTFREVEPGRRVVFGWGWEGNDDLKPDASTVTVTIEPDGDGSRVTLVHEGLDAQQEASHAEGWNHYLERLEKLATTGDAGQDEWAWAPEDLTPVSAAEAALAVIQPMLRNLTAEDRPKQTPVRGLHLPRPRRAPVRLARPARRDGRRDRGEPRGGLAREPGLRDGRAGDRRVARRSTSTAPSPAPAGRRCRRRSRRASCRSRSCCTAGTWPRAAASTLHVSDELVAYVRTLAEAVVPGGRGRGSFQDEVTPAPDASPLEKLAAFAGRTPVAA